METPDFVLSTNGTGEDISQWYIEEQAAEKLGLSLRTFQRLISEGKSKRFPYAPEKRDRRREGKRPEPVYSPTETDALAALARMRVIPPGAAHLYPGASLPQPETTFSIGGMDFAPGEIPGGLQFALTVLDRMATILERKQFPSVATPAAPAEPPRVDPQRLYLTISEASVVSGLSKSLLRRLAPQIAIRDGGRWKYPRAVLANSDTLAKLAQSLPKAVEKAAEDFARRYKKEKSQSHAEWGEQFEKTGHEE